MTETANKESKHLRSHFESLTSRLALQTTSKPTSAPFIPSWVENMRIKGQTLLVPGYVLILSFEKTLVQPLYSVGRNIHFEKITEGLFILERLSCSSSILFSLG